jgi:dTDP-4-dehydrorhamnose 3,5-epimerase
MKITSLEGACLLMPRRFVDARGFFVEQYNKRTLAEHGLTFAFVQDNLSLSKRKGTVRGLHFQPPPSEQTKLVSVVSGAVLDVMVDLRAGSPTFGRHAAVVLSAENGTQALIPRGFAHGFCTLSDDTLVLYKTDGYYDRARDLGLLWNDPDLGIRWPVDAKTAILTGKDEAHPRLKDMPPHFNWTGS